MNSPVTMPATLVAQSPITAADDPRALHRLPSALQLKAQLPLDHALSRQVTLHRQAVRAILNGEDARLLVVVGPCSIHDPKSALEYAERLARLAADVSDQLLIVMRAYVE